MLASSVNAMSIAQADYGASKTQRTFRQTDEVAVLAAADARSHRNLTGKL